MAEFRRHNLAAPDRTVELPLTRVDFVELGDFTIARTVHQPGWRWSEHLKPIVGGDWCRARHIGAILSGHARVVLSDGTGLDVGPDDAVDLPPGHDAWVVGDEPLVMIEFTGTNTFVGGAAATPWLATILFTDIVDSTSRAHQLGDGAWREVLGEHFRVALAILDRFGGTQVATTGDGILATFGGPVLAVAAASEVVDAANRQGLQVRAGIHVGEVHRVGDDVRGVAVHEAARIMAAAAPDEILLSETTRLLLGGLPVADKGLHTLKGLEGPRRLFAVRRTAGGSGAT